MPHSSAFEAFRILITKDTIIILNKLDKQVEYHPFNYIENIAHIPLNFSTLQDLIIGNPVYTGDSVVALQANRKSYFNRNGQGSFLKIFLPYLQITMLLERSKLDDIDVGQNRTADLSYGNYEKNNDFYFATYREITVAEKTKVDINLNYKAI